MGININNGNEVSVPLIRPLQHQQFFYKDITDYNVGNLQNSLIGRLKKSGIIISGFAGIHYLYDAKYENKIDDGDFILEQTDGSYTIERGGRSWK